MDDVLDKLESIAKAATPGEWSRAHRKTTSGYSTEVFCPKGETIATLAWYPRPEGNGATGTYRPDNAEHIATFSPERVLALLAVCRAARAVGYSNGFDAAFPDKKESLRTALAAFDAMEKPHA